MPRHIQRAPHLTDDELPARYRRADDPFERSHWAVKGTSSGCWLAA
ncbi:MAG TPA: hypothetical protein VKQ30_05875 [Ktedonobacterales bacterium]|nr:hypothetical protein [Ktedonobacterales bacterium]